MLQVPRAEDIALGTNCDAQTSVVVFAAGSAIAVTVVGLPASVPDGQVNGVGADIPLTVFSAGKGNSDA